MARALEEQKQSLLVQGTNLPVATVCVALSANRPLHPLRREEHHWRAVIGSILVRHDILVAEFLIPARAHVGGPRKGGVRPAFDIEQTM